MFFLQEGHGQIRKVVDSLNAVLATKIGGDRFSPLYELTFEYLDKDNQKALEFIEEVEKAALLSGDSLWIVKSKRVRGYILYKLERTQESIPSFETALEIAGRNDFDEEVKSICNPFALPICFSDNLTMQSKNSGRSLRFQNGRRILRNRFPA